MPIMKLIKYERPTADLDYARIAKEEGAAMHSAMHEIPDLYLWDDDYLKQLSQYSLGVLGKEELSKLCEVFLTHVMEDTMVPPWMVIVVYRHLRMPDDPSKFAFPFDKTTDEFLKSTALKSNIVDPNSISEQEVFGESSGMTPEEEGEEMEKFTEGRKNQKELLKDLSSYNQMIIAPVVAGMLLRVMVKSSESVRNSLEQKLHLIVRVHYHIDISNFKLFVPDSLITRVGESIQTGTRLAYTAILPTLIAFRASLTGDEEKRLSMKHLANFLRHLILLPAKWTGLKVFDTLGRIANVTGKYTHDILVHLMDTPAKNAAEILFSISMTAHKKGHIMWPWSRFVNDSFYASLAARFNHPLYAIVVFVLDLDDTTTTRTSPVYDQAITAYGEENAKAFAKKVLNAMGMSTDVVTKEAEKLKKVPEVPTYRKTVLIEPTGTEFDDLIDTDEEEEDL